MKNILLKIFRLIRDSSTRKSLTYLILSVLLLPVIAFAEAIVLFFVAHLLVSALAQPTYPHNESLLFPIQGNKTEIIVLMVSVVSIQIIKYWANKISFSSTTQISSAISERLLEQCYMNSVTLNSVEASNVITRYSFLTLLQAGVLLPASNLISSLLSLIVLVLVVSFKTGYIGPILLITASVPYLASFRRTKIILGKVSTNIASLATKLNFDISQLVLLSKELFIYDKFTEFMRPIKFRNNRYRSLQSDATILQLVPKLVLDASVLFGFLLVLYFIKDLPAEFSRNTGTSLIFATAILQRCQPYLTQLSGNFNLIVSNQHCLDVAVELATKKHEDDIGEYEIENNKTPNAGYTIPPFEYSLTNTSLPLLFSPVPLELPSTGLVVISGPSGVGKSTLLHLLMGVKTLASYKVSSHPTTDKKNLFRIKYDGRTRKAFLPSENTIYNGCLAENVALSQFGSDINMSSVKSCLLRAQLDEDIISYYSNYPNESGFKFNFSLGQLQRVNIARVLYSNPDLIFMDEPTSALDNENECRVFSALSELAESALVVCISHSSNLQHFATHSIKLSPGNGLVEIKRCG